MRNGTLAFDRSHAFTPNSVAMTQTGGAALFGYIGQEVGAAAVHTLVGAKIGAVLGTAFLPGLGTVVGGVLGVAVANWVIEFIDEL